MKIVKYFAMMAAVVATLAGCDGPNEGPNNGGESNLKVTASATTIYADGKDAVSFSVTLDGEAVEAGQVSAHDAENDNVVSMENLTFSTNTPGVYKFYFQYNNKKSNTVEITAVDAKFSKLDLSDVEGQEGLNVMATSTVFQRGQEAVFIIVRKDGKVVNDANKIKFYLNGSTDEITDTDFQMVDYVDANDDLYTLPQYTPAETGVRDIWLSYGSANTKNKPLRITAVDFAIPSRAIDTDPENTSFEARVLVNQFTGTGCPNCPRLIKVIKDLWANPNYADKFVHIGVHTYDSKDPMYYSEPGFVQAIGGVESYPAFVFDFRYGGSHSSQTFVAEIDEAQLMPAKAGIAARIQSDGITALARVSVKAAVEGEYCLAAMLVESNIVHAQSGDLNGDHKVHENALRLADGKNMGSYIGHSLGTLQAGETAEYLFNMPLKSGWVHPNCHIVFYVTTLGENGRTYEVTNAVASESLNCTVEFDYKSSAE